MALLSTEIPINGDQASERIADCVMIASNIQVRYCYPHRLACLPPLNIEKVLVIPKPYLRPRECKKRLNVPSICSLERRDIGVPRCASVHQIGPPPREARLSKMHHKQVADQA